MIWKTAFEILKKVAKELIKLIMDEVCKRKDG
jgi:hypothetical protein